MVTLKMENGGVVIVSSNVALIFITSRTYDVTESSNEGFYHYSKSPSESSRRNEGRRVAPVATQQHDAFYPAVEGTPIVQSPIVLM